MRKSGERGQAMMEYVMMLVLFLGILAALVSLLAVFSEYAWRILHYFAWEPFT